MCHLKVHEKKHKNPRGMYICPFKDTIKPLQLSVEKHQFFSQNNQWLNNISLNRQVAVVWVT